jgi:class 3 adenylate cyclase/tetratricopeptide (TPR) repeat protein
MVVGSLGEEPDADDERDRRREAGELERLLDRPSGPLAGLVAGFLAGEGPTREVGEPLGDGLIVQSVHGAQSPTYPEAMTCPACGSHAPAESRFCPTCGHALVARPDERRVATVLFADLVGFTTFSESADPEQVKELVDTCFQRLVSDVDAFGGQVDKIVGDAIVALFGAPIAHENDAERAVRAGLRMQETLAGLHDELGIDAAIRVGVNTGEVLVGALRAGGEYTAMGDVVNTASRLQTTAPPGAVVVGPATYEATHHAVRYERLGPLEVKGREAPVEAWAARELLTTPGERRARAKAPLVGRDVELDVLRTTLRAAVERRRAHFVLLSGDAGVGKTRLTRELGTEACERHGATVLHTHCAPYGETNPWFPVATALRTAANIDNADGVEVARAKCRAAVTAASGIADDDPEVGRVSDGLLYLMGISGPAPGVDPSRAREDAIRSLIEFFGALSERSLLVMTLSDLHWADDAVLDLVDRLLTGLHDRPFVLAATARAELAERWSPRPGRHNAATVHLEPLDAEAGATMAAALLGDAPPELVSLLVDRSGGNPFFIEELAAVIIETGDRSGGADLPMTLRGLVTARLDSLDPSVRSTLEDCAVVGAAGPVELVTALATDPGTAREALATLASRDFVELNGDEFSFRSELIRDVAYGMLTKAERARRHAHLTDLFAHPASDTNRIEGVLDQLTYHYGRATALVGELGHVEGIPDDMPERGARFMLGAVERAAEQENWSVLRRLSDMTLKLVETGGPRHTELILARAQARAGLRDCEGARADLDAVAALAEADSDDRLAARVRVLLGDVLYKENDLPGSRAVLDDAVERWRELDDCEGLADALRMRAQTEMFGGDLAGAEADALDALDRFRDVGNRRGEAWGLQTLAFVSFFSGAIDVTESRLDEAGALFADLGDWGGLGWALGLLAWLRYTQGRFAEAERLGRQVADDVAGTGDKWALGMMDLLLANIALWRGRPNDAIQLAGNARAVFAELPDAWGEIQALVPLARGQLCLGHLDHALDVATEMRPVAERLVGSPTAMLAPLVQAQLLVHAGDPRALAAVGEIGEAVQIITVGAEYATVRGLALLQTGRVDEAINDLEAGRGDVRWFAPSPAAGAALGLAYAAAGRAEEAAEVCEQVGPVAVSYLDELQQLIGLAFARLQLGAVDEALELLVGAVAHADATGSRLDQALARLARASALLAVGRTEGRASRAEAERLLARLHIPAAGWDRVFTLAAGAAAHA